MVNIYEYTDYRKFLNDCYEERRQKSKAFSCRNFARMVGLSSPSFFKMVIDGERNLSPETIKGFAKALRLSRHEGRFFEDLVRFNQARTHEEKNQHYHRLTLSKRFLKTRHLEKDQFEYFSKWYYAAVREMIALPDFREDPAWIARRLRPAITPAEARATIDLLLKLGLVARDRDGRLVQTDKSLATGNDVHSLALANFHRSMIQKAGESLEGTDGRDRSVSSLTAALSAEKFHEVKRRIDDFRKELRAIIEECDDPHAVYQLNFQLFRLTEVGHEA